MNGGVGRGLISGWAYKRNEKKMFWNDEISEKRIKANIPLHFELEGLISGMVHSLANGWAYIQRGL